MYLPTHLIRMAISVVSSMYSLLQGHVMTQQLPNTHSKRTRPQPRFTLAQVLLQHGSGGVQRSCAAAAAAAASTASNTDSHASAQQSPIDNNNGQGGTLLGLLADVASAVRR